MEIEGFPTTLTTWNAGVIRLALPPRATITQLTRGATLGHPNELEQQMRILKATLKLLEKDSPQKLVRLKEV